MVGADVLAPPFSTTSRQDAPSDLAAAVSPPVITLAVVLLGASYVGWHLTRGWIPFDDGTLAHTAERVLRGELPHRDFDDVYTGGLAFLDAGAFRLFGTNLLALRLPLFGVFLLWIAAVQYVASRFVRPLAAAGITAAAIAWSLPNYPAAMPSWYNLFLATFGTAALLRHLEDGRRRWIVLAGVAGGLSFLVKVIGLYYVAGAMLFFVDLARVRARAAAGPRPLPSLLYSAFVVGALSLFVVALALLVRHQHTPGDVAQFLIPGALLAALLARDEWSAPAGDTRLRLRSLADCLVPFFAGVAIPIVPVLAHYAWVGALGAFYHGVFVLPARRFGVSAMSPGSLRSMLALVPLLLVVVIASRVRTTVRRWLVAACALGALALLVYTGSNATSYQLVWHSVRAIPPVLTLVGAVVLSRPRRADASDAMLRSRCVLLLPVASLCSLVQFPFASANYFCYVAPLTLLAAVALWRYLPSLGLALPATITGFYLAFAVVRLNPTSLYTMGAAYRPYMETRPLPLERGGIDVPIEHAEIYGHAIPLLQHVARGGYTWASPEMPEVYFLSGLRNPTRTLFEFLDDTTAYTARTLALLESHHVTAIALNRAPRFSRRITPDLAAALAARYPYAADIGSMQVRWRR